MYKISMAAALCLTAWPALAQSGAANGDAPVPPVRYASPLADYRPAQAPAQTPAASWRAASAAVAGQGGMQHAGHGGHENHPMPAAPKQHTLSAEKDKAEDKDQDRAHHHGMTMEAQP